MKTPVPSIILLLVSSFLLAPSRGFAQSGRVKADTPTLDTRSAQALYEDVNNYVSKKYEEFNRQKLQFDPKLEENTKREQKELAAHNAATLNARPRLKGT